MTKDDIKFSPEFKAQTTRAIVSIVLFVVTYLLILFLSVFVAGWCVYAGIFMIVSFPGLITVALGLGLVSFGGLILIFLLKFIFKSHKVDRSHLHEITQSEEPELFKLIAEIVNEVGTDIPKKVYLSADVNASVFYDSGFWSMFLPVKKNLQIGLGLVNTVTKTELKAILSHEFGHFSQNTMKVGSYVYNLNQVIFNMLYDNDSYDKLVHNWASSSGILSVFVALAVRMIQGIQAILSKLYEIMNKSYMGLSREMEFHADEIAAAVTGFEPLKSSLLRMILADHSYNFLLSFYEGKIVDNWKSENLYKEHNYVMNFLADDHEIPVVNGWPEITVEELNKFNKSKLVIKDQWASHPSIDERIERLEKTGRTAGVIEHTPASDIFKDIEKTQKGLTDRLFDEIKYEGEVSSISFEEFKTAYKVEFSKSTFSKIYNRYYDDKNPSFFEINEVKTAGENVKFEALFSDDKVDLVYTALALENDIELMKQIAANTIPVKTFDYDGKKHKRKEIKHLLSKLNVELEEANEEIKQNDIRIFQLSQVSEQSLDKTPQVGSLYEEFFQLDKEFDSKYGLYTSLSDELQFINFVTPYDQIKANFVQLESIEVKLKNGIRELLSDSKYEAEVTKDMQDNFDSYLSEDWKYFSNEAYFDDNLEILFTAMNNYAFLLSKGYFLLKKKLLNYQETLMVN